MRCKSTSVKAGRAKIFWNASSSHRSRNTVSSGQFYVVQYVYQHRHRILIDSYRFMNINTLIILLPHSIICFGSTERIHYVRTETYVRTMLYIFLSSDSSKCYSLELFPIDHIKVYRGRPTDRLWAIKRSRALFPGRADFVAMLLSHKCRPVYYTARTYSTTYSITIYSLSSSV